MIKILCVGEALIDMICTDKNEPLSQGTHYVRRAGGAPTNVAAAIAALGGKTDLTAKVGIDPFGDHLVAVMNEFGVGTKWIFRDNAFTTFAFVSLMDTGDRDFYFNRGADGNLQSSELDQIPIDDYGIIHFGSATAFLPGPLQQAYLLLLQKAIAKNIFVSFDPNYRHLLFPDGNQSFIEQSWHFLSNADFFKLSDEEALLLTGKQNLQDAITDLLVKTKGVFTITLGKEGALLGFQGTQLVVPGITAVSVDSTGAGDAFAGAILYQLSKRSIDTIRELSKSEWVAVVSNANKAGARTCEWLGAMEAFKNLSNSIFD
ncbi:MAG: carbohydrate kinase [Chitinophagaceae bacterium]|nr:carbohydrate kinase [Chitinophagaceae bacterium]